MNSPTMPEDLDVYQRWESALAEETSFWDGVMRTGGDWPDEIRERLDPETPLQAELRALLVDRGRYLLLLDVGAGPFTTLGKKWEGRDIRITAVDPLASHYAELRAKYAIDAPVLTEHCDGELVGAKFPPNTFDLAYARNSLDHAYDPVVAITGMLHVVKSGGSVYLLHCIREADKQGHAGLHQHNFLVEDGSFIIETGGNAVNVSELVEDRAYLDVAEENGWVRVIMRKR